MRWAARVLFVATGVFLIGCEKNNRPPVAEDAIYQTLEEHVIRGRLIATDPDADPVRFASAGAEHGRVVIDSSGEFFFEPDVDFYGTAQFLFYATDGRTRSNFALVTVYVENVNDAPRIDAIPDLRNSPTAEWVDYQIAVFDPDPERPEVSVSARDPTVVDVQLDRSSNTLKLRALARGETTVDVVASDAETQTTASFEFSADERTKEQISDFVAPGRGAITLSNVADVDVDFVLVHNGFPVFENLTAVADYVKALPERFPGEGFGRKLWRFIRDSVYHDVPLNEKRWLYDPWVTLNSLGWGFCGHVAGSFVEIARAAGYNARVWGLSGHVVPEIEIDGEWRMLDPDLAVYYKTADGRFAGVQDLVADPSLIIDPIDPILDGNSGALPYSEFIADVYSTSDDNFDGEDTFLPAEESPQSRIVLPPGATLTYPGRWTEAPIGYDGTIPYEVRAYNQALLQLPDGWTGEIRLPWVAWAVNGAGQVGVDGDIFDAGSEALTERLRDTDAPIVSLQVYASSGIEIVFMINAVRFDLEASNTVDIRSLHAWAIAIGETDLARDQAAGSLPDYLKKPLPTVVP